MTRVTHVGTWKVQDVHDGLVIWRRELSGYGFGRRQVATMWVEESATGDGFIAWATVEPEGEDTVAIVDNGQEVSRDTAIKYAIDWMERNQYWPDRKTEGLGGFDWV